MEVGIESKAN